MSTTIRAELDDIVKYMDERTKELEKEQETLGKYGTENKMLDDHIEDLKNFRHQVSNARHHEEG